MSLLLYFPSAFDNNSTPVQTVVSPASRSVSLIQGTQDKQTWAETLDPSDYLDYATDCAGLKESGETIASFTMLPAVEAALMGLQIDNTSLVSNVVQGWFSINTNDRNNPLFNAGINLPVEVTLVMSSGRIWQRTTLVKVSQR